MKNESQGGFFQGGIKFFWIRQRGPHDSNAKIILKIVLIQK